jgi:hypothetical protein
VTEHSSVHIGTFVTIPSIPLFVWLRKHRTNFTFEQLTATAGELRLSALPIVLDETVDYVEYFGNDSR